MQPSLATPVVSVTTPSLPPQGVVYSAMPTAYSTGELGVRWGGATSLVCGASHQARGKVWQYSLGTGCLQSQGAPLGPGLREGQGNQSATSSCCPDWEQGQSPLGQIVKPQDPRKETGQTKCFWEP